MKKQIEQFEFPGMQCLDKLIYVKCKDCGFDEVIHESNKNNHQCENCRHKAYSIELQ